MSPQRLMHFLPPVADFTMLLDTFSMVSSPFHHACLARDQFASGMYSGKW
jgi:hypothetical protein